MAAATGTASMSIPVPVSPGRGGFQPSLSLAYSSGAGNGPFGIGWSLGVPSIARKTDKKLPEYRDGTDSDVFILSGAEDLVRELEFVESTSTWRPKIVTRGDLKIERFRPRTEGLFARIERRTNTVTGNVCWVAIDRNNVTSIYGQAEGARIADPADTTKVFSWLLEATYDDRGNVCLYEYAEEELDNVPFAAHEIARREGAGVDAQRYLKRVRYGNRVAVTGDDLDVADLTPTEQAFCFTVLFDYGEHSSTAPTIGDVGDRPCRQDPFSSFKSGFELRTYRLCRRVLMFHHFDETGHLGEDPVLVRSLDLAYDEGPSVTYLTSATQKGHLWNGTSYDATPMPPVSFSYREPTISSVVRDLPESARQSLPPSIDGRVHQWVDLDGEGIAGLLSEEAGAWRYRRNLGGGRFGGPRVLPTRPSTAALATSRQQLLSLEGDGRLELVELSGPAPGFFTREPEKDTWASFVPFKAIPVGLDWNDPNLQFIDLNGDGFADVLVTHGESLVWYPSRGREGFAAPITLHVGRNEKNGPVVLFAEGEQSIHLADMSGDGLADIARIRNGEICYWPNLGYGRFGARITMSSAPRFDRRDQFDPARIRLFDVDGSGTTDVLYLGADAVTLWLNESGNGWSDAHVVTRSLPTHSAASISVLDLLGTGTGCLTWFTTLTSEGAPRLRYIDLLESKKPHLLIAQDNGMGLERLITYASSTKFYLDDRAAGVKWATRLPFPVQVVERVEVRDYLAGTRLVSRYGYRHGYFDGHEREFRGFGLVEQWDAESFDSDVGDGTFPEDLFPEVDGEFLLPPVHTKTWFHTGAWKEQHELTEIFRGEYYAGDEDAVDLPGTAFSTASLSIEEQREAARALKGMVLRQEVYADDGTGLAARPYTVSERCYEVRRIQPRVAGNPHAVFLSHPREELTYHYERTLADPRTLHALTLEVDDYGTVVHAATIAYPRRTTGETAQNTMLVTVAEQVVTHATDEAHVWYRVGVPVSSTSYQLTGLAAPSAGDVLSFDTVFDAVEAAAVIAYDVDPAGGTTLELRVLGKQRTYYYEDDLSAALPLGNVESRALVHHQEQLAMSAGLVETIYNDPTETVTETMLTTECGYLVDDNDDCWAPSGRPVYDDEQFYLPVGMIHPFGNESSVEYDTYSLLVVKAHSSVTTSALDNVIEVENDYRVLQPKKLEDPNDNRTELAFDALGMVVTTAVMGKVGSSDGDSISNPTTTFEYDLLAFVDGLEEDPPVFAPVSARMRARKQHGGTAVWQERYVYTDGSARELLTKSQAAPHPDTPTTARWVGTGRTVYDNKGNPIKKYEPYFSSTSDYESEAAIVETGVTPILRYDPLERLIRTDFPDGTYSKVVFDPWKQETHDQNDTVLDSVWYDEHSDSGASAEDQRAAQLTEAHADTPTTTHLDVLGRAVIVVQHNGFTGSPPAAIEYATTTTLDVAGNPLEVEDARGNTPLANVFDLLARPIKTVSAEAGASKILPDIAGTPVRSWNSRDVVMRTKFDAVRRPTHVYSKIGTATETLVLRTIYGEELGSSASLADNLRGQIYRNYDSAGAETFLKRDFKGNLLETHRKLTVAYTTTPDWMLIDTITSASTIESTIATAALLQSDNYVTKTTYDALNRVITSTAPDDSVHLPTYNEASQLSAMDVKIRGASTATSFVTSIRYNARGQRDEIVYANNTKTIYEYDEASFLLTKLNTTRTISGTTTVLQELTYWYDPVGNIVEVHDAATQSAFFTDTSTPDLVSGDNLYKYDPLYRLIEAHGREHPGYFLNQTDENDLSSSSLPHPNDTTALVRYREEYAYDSVGNILHVRHRDGATTPPTLKWTRYYQYFTTSNRLAGTSDGDAEETPYVATTTDYTDAYTHDARGNMTSMPHITTMSWDYGDRLQQCALGGGGNAYFNYDAGGNRVRKVWVNNTTSIVDERVYVGGYEVWRHRVSGTLDEEQQTLHVMDDQRRIAMVETKTVAGGSTVSSPTSYQRYQLDDHLGSSRVECDHTGALLTYEEYHPYGTTAFRASSGASGFAPKRYRYNGKERDDETGLYYYGARYYPPWLARWTAVDPAGSGINVYEYCAGNPITFIDPDGRVPVKITTGDPRATKEVKDAKGNVGTQAVGAPFKTSHGSGTLFIGGLPGRNLVEPKPTPSGLPGNEGVTTEGHFFKAAEGGVAWQRHVTLTEVPSGMLEFKKNSLGKEYATSEWRLEVVQTVEGLNMTGEYENGRQIGLVVDKGTTLLDPQDSPSSVSVEDLYTHGAKTGALHEDDPKFVLPEKVDGKQLTNVEISGRFHTYVVLVNPNTKEKIYVWHTQYDVNRKWTWNAKLQKFEGTGDLVRSKDEPGVGSAGPPPAGGPTANSLLQPAVKSGSIKGYGQMVDVVKP